jgi:type I restriction enzyme R subunit
MSKTSENTLEQTTLGWFESLGWQTAFGPDISPDGPACEREDYDQVVLLGRLGYQLKPGQLSATLALQQPGISTNCRKHYFVPLGTFENSPAIYCRDENTNPTALGRNRTQELRG